VGGRRPRFVGVPRRGATSTSSSPAKKGERCPRGTAGALFRQRRSFPGWRAGSGARQRRQPRDPRLLARRRGALQPGLRHTRLQKQAGGNLLVDDWKLVAGKKKGSLDLVITPGKVRRLDTRHLARGRGGRPGAHPLALGPERSSEIWHIDRRRGVGRLISSGQCSPRCSSSTVERAGNWWRAVLVLVGAGRSGRAGRGGWPGWRASAREVIHCPPVGPRPRSPATRPRSFDHLGDGLGFTERRAAHPDQGRPRGRRTSSPRSNFIKAMTAVLGPQGRPARRRDRPLRVRARANRSTPGSPRSCSSPSSSTGTHAGRLVVAGRRAPPALPDSGSRALLTEVRRLRGRSSRAAWGGAANQVAPPVARHHCSASPRRSLSPLPEGRANDSLPRPLRPATRSRPEQTEAFEEFPLPTFVVRDGDRPGCGGPTCTSTTRAGGLGFPPERGRDPRPARSSFPGSPARFSGPRGALRLLQRTAKVEGRLPRRAHPAPHGPSTNRPRST